MDVASIEGGIDYLQVIRDTIASCDVCVAVIADNWWSASDASGARRLDDPSDLLRVELVGALRAGISVIPCIVDEAEFPAESELPEELRPLANRQQVNIAHRSFDRDTDVLIRAIREAFARAERQRRQARYERWQRQFVSPASAFARRKPVCNYGTCCRFRCRLRPSSLCLWNSVVFCDSDADARKTIFNFQRVVTNPGAVLSVPRGLA
jgi:hypothetical protein